ncbi:MAG TPA: hypothetical protein VMI56_27965 [Reyranella sp.]|nr:hypothetical protein [Reyranella sp.]
MVLRFAYLAAAIAAALLTGAADAADSISRFRMKPDPRNESECHGLDDNMALEHIITVNGNDAEIASRGGIVGRMVPVRRNVFRLAFELEGKRVDAMVDFAAQPVRLVVTERERSCRWSATPEK